MFVKCISVKQSTIVIDMQYVLIELFRNVFLEKTMMLITFPINPMKITAASIANIVLVKDASDIFSSLFFKFFSFCLLKKYFNTSLFLYFIF